MTYQDFLAIINYMNKPREQRLGQFMFNVLSVFRSDLADQIRSTNQDPYYDNDNIPAMITWLAEHWTTEEP